MSKVEEVKAILERLDREGRYDDVTLTIDAKDICKLFEVSPVPGRLVTYCIYFQ